MRMPVPPRWALSLFIVFTILSFCFSTEDAPCGHPYVEACAAVFFVVLPPYTKRTVPVVQFILKTGAVLV
jgi:hypothetical protein